MQFSHKRVTSESIRRNTNFGYKLLSVLHRGCWDVPTKLLFYSEIDFKDTPKPPVLYHLLPDISIQHLTTFIKHTVTWKRPLTSVRNLLQMWCQSFSYSLPKGNSHSFRRMLKIGKCKFSTWSSPIPWYFFSQQWHFTKSVQLYWSCVSDTHETLSC